MVTSIDAQDAIPIYCMAAKYLMGGKMPTEGEGLSASKNAITTYRDQMAELIFTVGETP